jgi:excisionase family DNA binding protein
MFVMAMVLNRGSPSLFASLEIDDLFGVRPMPIELDDVWLFTVEETCERLNIKKTKAYVLINAGKLRAVRAGGQTLIPAAALREYVEALPDHRPSETPRSALMRDVQLRRRIAS